MLYRSSLLALFFAASPLPAFALDYVGDWATKPSACRRDAMHYRSNVVYDTDRTGFDCKVEQRARMRPSGWKLTLHCADTVGDGSNTYTAVHTLTLSHDRRNMHEEVVMDFGHKTETSSKMLTRCP